MVTPVEHLKNFITERLPGFQPAVFEEGEDIPSFTVDTKTGQLKQPPYPNWLTINSALLGYL